MPVISDDGQTPAPPAQAPEIIAVTSHRVCCDGAGGALGHPRVWLEMGSAPFVECPYCDRRFVIDAQPGAPASNHAPS